MAPAFDTSQVSPADAIATLRSLRRRFTEILDRAQQSGEAEQSGENVAAASSSSSLLTHAAWTARAIEAVGVALHHVMVEENPAVDLPPIDPPAGGGSGGESAEAVLARLGDQAEAVAGAMADLHGDDWSRRGRGPHGEVSALDIARLGIQIAVEHLRAAERAVD